MKQYLLSVCYPADGKQPPPDVLQRIMRDVHAIQHEMQAAGVWVFSGGLHPANTATVLRHQGGDVVTTDGPFIETKELLGGFIVLDVPDEATALRIAGDWPGLDWTDDAVEVRCSSASRVLVAGQGYLMSHSSGIAMTRTSVSLAPLATSPWLRVIVVDDTGRSAWSNPIWK